MNMLACGIAAPTSSASKRCADRFTSPTWQGAAAP